MGKKMRRITSRVKFPELRNPKDMEPTVMAEDWEGELIRVPVSKLEEFKANQKEILRKVESGEIDPEAERREAREAGNRLWERYLQERKAMGLPEEE